MGKSTLMHHIITHKMNQQTTRAEQIIQELARPTSAPMQQPIENVADAHPERKTPHRRQRSKRNTTKKPNDTTNEAPQEKP